MLKCNFIGFFFLFLVLVRNFFELFILAMFAITCFGYQRNLSLKEINMFYIHASMVAFFVFNFC